MWSYMININEKFYFLDWKLESSWKDIFNIVKKKKGENEWMFIILIWTVLSVIVDFLYKILCGNLGFFLFGEDLILW